ncbi:hypothetical protein C5167_031486 [Papaver somniferum]|uniref:Uncharacterized protein n=1 Tax=Papaver somniferum TaxID=3469 RepID=A0A4Y7K7A6_PAPSO|nr:hypothetical protein C5167_031486 [Papaver somniferum]
MPDVDSFHSHETLKVQFLYCCSKYLGPMGVNVTVFVVSSGRSSGEMVRIEIEVGGYANMLREKWLMVRTELGFAVLIEFSLNSLEQLMFVVDGPNRLRCR